MVLNKFFKNDMKKLKENQIPKTYTTTRQRKTTKIHNFELEN